MGLLALVFFLGLLWSFHGMGAPWVQLALAIVGSVAYVALFRTMCSVIDLAAETPMPGRLLCWSAFLGLVVLKLGVWFGLLLLLERAR